NHINAGNTMIFEDYRKKLGRSIMVLGALTHPELFYNAVNILVLPFKRPYAFTEPPLVVLEALSSGTPLITTPMGSIAEYTEHEYNAIHVAPHPRDIANAINKLIQGEDLRQRLSRNSRVSAMKLSLKNVGRQLLEIYRELYEERNGLVRAL
ncbi:MAG: glycosyltransferase family 4 protein, partial [Candidatus Bathyarchaeia archaeon]